MGSKLWFTGAALVLAKTVLPIPAVEVVGGVLLVIGTVLIWLDR